MLIRNNNFNISGLKGLTGRQHIKEKDTDDIFLGEDKFTYSSVEEKPDFLKLKDNLNSMRKNTAVKKPDSSCELSRFEYGLCELHNKTDKMFDYVKNKAGEVIELKDHLKNGLKAGFIKPGNSMESRHVQDFLDLFKNGQVKPGDIILISKPSNGSFHPMSSSVPGKYSHVAIYLGKNEKGEHITIDSGFPATRIRNVDWWPRGYNKWAVLSPRKNNGEELTDEDRKKVVDFAKTAEGTKYSFAWPINRPALPVSKDDTRFYCSQLAWQSYNQTLGINIGKKIHKKYHIGIAPDHIFSSENTTLISSKENIPDSVLRARELDKLFLSVNL